MPIFSYTLSASAGTSSSRPPTTALPLDPAGGLLPPDPCQNPHTFRYRVMSLLVCDHSGIVAFTEFDYFLERRQEAQLPQRNRESGTHVFRGLLINRAIN